MKNNKGIVLAAFLWLLVIVIMIILKIYFPSLLKDKNTESNNIQYQLVDNIDNSKYMQCIAGAKYIVATSFFGSDSVARLTNSSGESESCEVKIYNGDQMSSMMKSNPKLNFIMVH